MKTENKSSGATDDALVLQGGTGNTSLTHGLTVDTFTRTVPIRTVPWFVRDSIFRAWHGMSGRQVDYSATPLPWYAYNALGTDTTDSVASRLSVTVQDAEEWGRGDQASQFGFYADVPLNPQSMARWAFWRYDPLAAELDPAMALEPQAYALDAFSQLYTESCTFHFGYLADVDKEYHRLRPQGPLGRLDSESSAHEPWFHLYNYWRNQLETTYLSGATPLVTLPQHLRDGNWTIADVLNELYTMMTVAGGNLDPDIIITAKGYNNGVSSITLGIQDDASMHDADGNTRFYHPYMEAQPIQQFTMGLGGKVVEHLYATDHSDLPQIDGPDNTSLNRDTLDYNINTTFSRNYVDLSGIWKAYAGANMSNVPLNSTSSWAQHMYNQYTARYTTNPGQPYYWANPALGASSAGYVLSDFMSIRDLPQSGTIIDSGTQYRYWSGHTLNLVQLILFAKEIGRAIEPEVLDTLIYPMGVVGTADSFVRRPSGASARQLDELYNLYETGYSFNENPNRTYTAAHLGPMAHKLARGDVTIAGSSIDTQSGTKVLTARERYWSPSTITDSSAGNIAATFFPGVRFDLSMFRGLNVEALAQYNDSGLREFLSRALGDVPSMRTKLERPIYLPAGRSGPETVYASGVGLGAVQLVMEMMMSISGARPRFGLGHHGYSDLRVSDGEFVTRSASNTDPEDALLLNFGSLVKDQGMLNQFVDAGSIDPDLVGNFSTSDYTQVTPETLADWKSSLPLYVSTSINTASASSTIWNKNIGRGNVSSILAGNLDMAVAAAMNPRLVNGGNGAPLETATCNLGSGPSYLEWGVKQFTGTDIHTPFANSDLIVQDTNGDPYLFGLWKVPTQVKFIDSAGVEFTVDVGSPAGDGSPGGWLDRNLTAGAPGRALITNWGETMVDRKSVV